MQSSPPDPELLRRIPLSAHTILDVGCGTGALTAAYRLMNPAARLLGIDADPAAAAAAAGHMNEVAIVDVDHQPLPSTSPKALTASSMTGFSNIFATSGGCFADTPLR